MNDITLDVVGNVVNDVELRFTPSGEAVASFRVASTTRRFDRANERWIDGDTHYFTVSCWRQMAHNVAASLMKGMPVVVTGRMRSREHEKVCGDHTHMMRYVDIEAIAVGADLARGTSVFTKTRKDSVVESERRMLADALGQDTVDYLDRIGADGEQVEDAEHGLEAIDLETGEIVGVG
jgi:single-strand DNA-binding protein